MSSTVARNVFPFLSLPSELRLMIIRAISLFPVADLISAFNSIASTCKQLHAEVLHEFLTNIFPRGQLHLSSYLPRKHQRKSPTYKLMKALQSSPLLTNSIQHVSLTWGGCSCADGGYYTWHTRGAGLKWLSQLPQLRTLEIIFVESKYHGLKRFTREGYVPPLLSQPQPALAEGVSPLDDERFDRDWDEFFCELCYERGLMMLPPSLEKLVFRVWSDEDEAKTFWADDYFGDHPGTPDDNDDDDDDDDDAVDPHSPYGYALMTRPYTPVPPASRIVDTWDATEWYRRIRAQEEMHQMRRMNGRAVPVGNLRVFQMHDQVCSCGLVLSNFNLCTI